MEDLTEIKRLPVHIAYGWSSQMCVELRKTVTKENISDEYIYMKLKNWQNKSILIK